jgi:hypothetical protein
VQTDIGPYKIVREIGHSPLGLELEALDQRNSKKVVLKRPSAELVTPAIRARLHSESRALALLNHPNIAKVFGFIRRNEELFLITEFVSGERLQKLLGKERYSHLHAVNLMQPIISAVKLAHGIGIVHGHLHPETILVTENGALKILDFGIAHIFGGFLLSPSQYTSPERLRGEPADVRSDVYSLGVLFYQLLAGKGPFDGYGTTGDASATADLIPAPPSLFVPELPAGLDSFVLRAMAPSPSNRFPTVQAFSRELSITLARRSAAVSKTTRRRHWRLPALGRTSAANGARWFGKSCGIAIGAAGNAFAEALGVLDKLAGASARASARVFYQLRSGARSSSAALLPNCRDELRKFRRAVRDVDLRASVRRYALNTCLAALLFVEMLYFGGSNIFTLVNSWQSPATSLNDAVDTMFTRLEQQQSAKDGTPVPSAREPVGQSLHRAAAAPATRRPVTERNAANREPIGIRAARASAAVPDEPAKRLPNNDSSPPAVATAAVERQSRPPLPEPAALKEAKPSEPVPPAKSTQNAAPKTMLDVKWEN